MRGNRTWGSPPRRSGRHLCTLLPLPRRLNRTVGLSRSACDPSVDRALTERTPRYLTSLVAAGPTGFERRAADDAGSGLVADDGWPIA